MRKVTKLIAISLLVIGLAACDDATKDSKAPADNAAAQTSDGLHISLLDGKLTFALPNGMADQSGKLGNQTNNMHVYADSTGQRALIVILAEQTPDTPDVLIQRLEQQQRSRDANLQLIANKAIEVGGVPLRQLDTIITSDGQKAYSSVVMGLVDDQLLTLQITLPADNQQLAQREVEDFISTLKLSK